MSSQARTVVNTSSKQNDRPRIGLLAVMGTARWGTDLAAHEGLRILRMNAP